MKPFISSFCAAVLGGGLLLLTSPYAGATISVQTSDSFGDMTINPASGTISFINPLQTSAYAQAGADTQYGTTPSTANASDTPGPGASATGMGTSMLSPLSGTSSATGFIPATVSGYDTSTGRASASGTFQILGATGPVSVMFSMNISGSLDLSADLYGVSGQGEAVDTLSINNNAVLAYDDLLTIGPGQTLDQPFQQTLNGSMTLMANTPYNLWVEGDAEAMVVNQSTAVVPEPPVAGLAMVGLAMFGVFSAGARRGMARVALFAVIAVSVAIPAQAKYIGGERKKVCKTCGVKSSQLPAGKGETSVAEGNNGQNYPVCNPKCGYGLTVPLALTYNSDDADGSKAQLDTGLGFGWTHTYNSMLFQQRGQMFRFGPDGRVTHYNQNFSGPAGTYTSDPGYFETIVQQPDGTFFITNKYQDWWHYGSVPNSPFLIGGPVYQLLQMGDRNHNVTAMTYNSTGLLTTVTDPFGRTLQFTYNSSNHVSTITDPMGRVTQFQYDPENRVPTQITDPMGNVTQYTYNSQYQITRKVDKDGRMYFYTFKNQLPFMVTDGSGLPYLSMTNPTNWSVNATNLAFNLERTYNPNTSAVTDGDGHIWQFTYDANGYITQQVAPDGATTQWTYDPGTLQVATMTDADGNTTQWTYDSEGNRISTTDALGDVTTWTYDPTFNEVTSMTDPLGRVTDWTYDGNGNQLLMTDPLNQTESWTYDAHGNVLTHTDKNGYTTTNVYDGMGEHISSTDPLGNTTRWAYDSNGNLLSMTDPLGHMTEWTYDPLDRAIGMTNAMGGVVTWTYDPSGNTLTITDPNSNTTTWQYDDRNRQIETIDALGGVSQWTYDANDNVITATDQNGNARTNAYDLQNRQIETIDPLGGTTHWTYDAQGNQLSSTDQDGNTTRWNYDALNRVIERTDALGGITTFDYAMAGGPPCCSSTPGTSLLTELQDADGHITYFHYDELDRRTQVVRKNSDTNNVINATDAATTWAYDADNNIIAATDPNGNTTTWTYDADDRKIGSVDAAGDTTQWSYDADGNVAAVTAPNLNVITQTFDPLNRVISRTDGIGLIDSTAYDPNGNVLSMTDGLGHTTAYLYDGLNRQTSMTDALGHAMTTDYDPDGNVTSTTDRNGQTTDFTYDALDRRVTVTDALGHITTTDYDPVGNVIDLTDANDHTTTYTYDPLNRQVAETYADSPPNTRTYMYDAIGNVISRTDQNGQVTAYSYNALYYETNRVYSPSGSIDQFTYDDGGRMLSANRNGWTDTFAYDGADRLTNTVQNGRTLTYTYNIPGRTQTNTYPSGRVINYAYDARDRLLTLNDTTLNPPIATFAYDVADRVVGRNYRNGTTAAYTYNANNWIVSLNHSNAASLITGFNYAYDNEGNRLYEQKTDNPGNSSAYTYDAINRLTNYDVGALSGLTVPSPTIAKTWALDPVGNWNNLVSNGAPDLRTYGPANELLTDNGSNYLYDADGDITQDNSYNYSYDEENRLTQVQRRSDSAIVGQYAYDALGRRVVRIVNPAGLAATNNYYYDDARVIEEQDAGGSTLATYTYGNYIDETLTMDRGSQTYYYHQNAMSSPHALTDSSGVAVERYAYDAYGQPTVMDGSYHPLPLNPWGTPHSTVTNRFLFTGRELDEETGLDFYRARYFDAIKGRFLERDPFGYVDGMNLYQYTDDSPINKADPWGLTPPIGPIWNHFANNTLPAMGNGLMEGMADIPSLPGAAPPGGNWGGMSAYNRAQGLFMGYDFIMKMAWQREKELHEECEKRNKEQFDKDWMDWFRSLNPKDTNPAFTINPMDNRPAAQAKRASAAIAEGTNTSPEVQAGRDNQTLVRHYLENFGVMPTAQQGFTGKPFVPRTSPRYVVKEQIVIPSWTHRAGPVCVPEGNLMCVDTDNNKTMPFNFYPGGETFYKYKALGVWQDTLYSDTEPSPRW